MRLCEGIGLNLRNDDTCDSYYVLHSGGRSYYSMIFLILVLGLEVFYADLENENNKLCNKMINAQ